MGWDGDGVRSTDATAQGAERTYNLGVERKRDGVRSQMQLHRERGRGRSCGQVRG